jgi:hypothetical protein
MGGVNEEGQKVSFFTESLNPAVKPTAGARLELRAVGRPTREGAGRWLHWRAGLSTGRQLIDDALNPRQE